MNKICVQFGCGASCPEGWMNYDSSFSVILQRLPLLGGVVKSRSRWKVDGRVLYGDIYKGLPHEHESVDLIYSSHVIEHLTLEEAIVSFNNVYSYLKVGGVFRSVLPDMEYYINQYTHSKEIDALDVLLSGSLLGQRKRPKKLTAKIRNCFANSNHLWMWDYKSIEYRLLSAGFKTVRRAEMGDSEHREFEKVENSGRWINCLGFEAVK